MDWEMILSGVTAVTAIIGIWLTGIQICKSNKQALFEKRVKYMVIVSGLVKLYKDNREGILKDINDKNSPDFSNDIKFCYLTNNTYLSTISNVIQHPKDDSIRKNFLTTLEDMEKLSWKIKLSFKRKASRLVGDFVYQYQETLRKMYGYQLVLNKIDKCDNKEHKKLEEWQEETGEPKFKKEIWEEYGKLEDAYNKLVKNKSMKKLKKQTKI
ncbi:hypothetical protein AALT52_07515 [Ligilactobacillus faecis]|uniref:DUF4760 domain-containing protein n=1 Tax=Ligilactobacillus faecis TaxID=762833 RepID=A0ABV4DSL3_9LACO